MNSTPIDKLPVVAVLMSTYNGEKFLREQLESIFTQEDVEILLIVRDDGSTDSTIEILNEFSGIQIIESENVGCEESFKKLLYMPIDADYYAFSDQDDVWYPRKLISAINNLKQHDSDLSVCNLMLADADMNLDRPLFKGNELHNCNLRFRNYVLGNIHGCTQVWTKKLHKIIQSYEPKIMYGHDVWVNCIANMVSSTYIDNNCQINYRLHENNTSGYATNEWQRIKKGITKYLTPKAPSNYLLCRFLIAGYSKYVNIDEKRFESIKLIAHYKDSFQLKCQLLMSKFINTGDFRHRIFNWIRIIINKY